MRTDSAPCVQHLPGVSDLGVLFLYAANLGIRVRYGSLVIDLGRGRMLTIDRASEPRLRRLVIAGHGWWTFEVSRWLADIGASWVQLDLTGRVLGSGPGHVSPDLPALRRQQALAAGADLGQAIGRWLLTAKIENQARVLSVVDHTDQVRAEMLNQVELLKGCSTSTELRIVEARAASMFWNTLADVPVRFVAADEANVPASWRYVGRRASAVTGAARGASTCAHAAWNFAYSCAATEVEASLRGCGLDTGISPTGLHADTPARSSATYDLLEPIRGDVDHLILAMIIGRRFRRRDFVQLADGRARLTAPLAREIAEAVIPAARQAVAPIAEQLARTLADGIDGPPSHVGVLPANLTGDARSRGREGIRKVDRKVEDRSARAARSLVPRACRACGGSLNGPSDTYCGDCSVTARTEKGLAASARARARLQELRAAGHDPSQTVEAKRKVGQRNRQHNLARRAWDLAHDRPEPEVFRVDILPGLQGIPLSRIAEAGGFSVQHAGLVRRGIRTPHPMTWDSLRELGEGS